MRQTSDNGKLTIRIPSNLHAAIRELAFERRMSMNELAVQLLTEAVTKNAKAATVLRNHRCNSEPTKSRQ